MNHLAATESIGGGNDVASFASGGPSDQHSQHASAGLPKAQPTFGGIPFRQTAADRSAPAWLPTPANSIPFQAPTLPPVTRASWLPPPHFTSSRHMEPQAPPRDAIPLPPLPSVPVPASTAGRGAVSTAAAASPVAAAAEPVKAAEDIQPPASVTQLSAPVSQAEGQQPPVARHEVPPVVGGSALHPASPARGHAPDSTPAGDGQSAPDAQVQAAARSEAESAGEAPDDG